MKWNQHIARYGRVNVLKFSKINLLKDFGRVMILDTTIYYYWSVQITWLNCLLKKKKKIQEQTKNLYEVNIAMKTFLQYINENGETVHQNPCTLENEIENAWEYNNETLTITNKFTKSYWKLHKDDNGELFWSDNKNLINYNLKIEENINMHKTSNAINLVFKINNIYEIPANFNYVLPQKKQDLISKYM